MHAPLAFTIYLAGDALSPMSSQSNPLRRHVIPPPNPNLNMEEYLDRTDPSPSVHPSKSAPLTGDFCMG